MCIRPQHAQVQAVQSHRSARQLQCPGINSGDQLQRPTLIDAVLLSGLPVARCKYDHCLVLAFDEPCRLRGEGQ
jgi:hypothetical protein